MQLMRSLARHRLGAAPDALLKSDTGALNVIEVIVVNDGSPEPVAPIVEARAACRRISLRCIRQPSAGPAAAVLF
jgi:glycosyltransferase involved in cell wall biosynthesis